MEIPKAPIYYRLKPAIVAPILVSAAAISLAFVDSPWWLLAIPFVILASICAQPNMNLADGCLTYLAIIIGYGVISYHRPLGIAICTGSLVSFFLSALEKRLTAEPVYADSANETGDQKQPTEQDA